MEGQRRWQKLKQLITTASAVRKSTINAGMQLAFPFHAAQAPNPGNTATQF